MRTICRQLQTSAGLCRQRLLSHHSNSQILQTLCRHAADSCRQTHLSAVRTSLRSDFNLNFFVPGSHQVAGCTISSSNINSFQQYFFPTKLKMEEEKDVTINCFQGGKFLMPMGETHDGSSDLLDFISNILPSYEITSMKISLLQCFVLRREKLIRVRAINFIRSGEDIYVCESTEVESMKKKLEKRKKKVEDSDKIDKMDGESSSQSTVKEKVPCQRLFPLPTACVHCFLLIIIFVMLVRENRTIFLCQEHPRKA